MENYAQNNDNSIKGFIESLEDIQSTKTESQLIEPGMCVFETSGLKPEEITFSIDVQKELILYFFPEKGNFSITATIGEGSVGVGERAYLMAAYPFNNWGLGIRLEGKGKFKGIAFTLTKLHELFGNLSLNDPEVLKEAIRNYRLKSFYSLKDYHARIQLVIHQLFESNDAGIAGAIYRRGKVMEFLSMFIDPDVALPEEKDGCPYITNNLDLEKIRNAEKILVDSMEDPPTIRELAREVGTNELKLKTGFKHLFGNTVYGYLTDQRMETARLLLEKHRMQIKDVAGRVGYANPSHFIAAFRKKYGVTPKKYLLSL